MSVTDVVDARVVTEPLAAHLRAQLGPDRVITDLTRLRTYECDGITG